MRFGVMGTGQLAWMLSLAAEKLGLRFQYVDGTDLLDSFDYLTFESEFLDYGLWKSKLNSKKVYPALDVMQKLSDKWEQKQLFREYQLPTAPAELYAHEECPSGGGTHIAKWTRQGYDGYGNLVLDKSVDDFSTKWKSFYEKAQKQNSRIYLEELVPFECECALVVARDSKGDFLKYPVVLTEQSKNVCNWVWGPAAEFIPDLQKKADELWPQIQNFLKSMDYVGVIAFEFFWVNQTLMLNEVAPRVHNSGHITLDAFNYSQFDLHLMAPLGFSGIQLEAKSKFYVMKNLLGVESFKNNLGAVYEKDSSDITTYWYGKDEVRVGRKMGHLNYLYSDQTQKVVKEVLEKKEEMLWQKLKAIK